MEDSNPITMKDIARELGVSIATVSRALNGSNRISEQTRRSIQAYADEHKFYPNVIGKQLRLAKSTPIHILGVIVPQIVHYYFSTIISGIEREASARGYQIIVAQSNEDYQREVAICESFLKNKVAGIIVSQAKTTKDYAHFQQILDKRIPLVFFDRICTGVDASRVVVDDYQGAFTAVSHLIDTGCRRIAYYGSPLNMEISKNRYNGYKDALLRHKIKVDESLVAICDDRATADAITPDILQREFRPDGFFCVNDDTALGILYTAKHMGFRVPQDISICGFSDGFRAQACDPMLTTIEQRGEKVGMEAASIAIGKIEGTIPATKIERRVVKTKLIVRGTTTSKDTV